MEQIRPWYQKCRLLQKKNHSKLYTAFSKFLCCVNHFYKKAIKNLWELVVLQYFIIQKTVFPARFSDVSILSNLIPSSFLFNTQFMNDPLPVRQSSSNAFFKIFWYQWYYAKKVFYFLWYLTFQVNDTLCLYNFIK